MLLRNRPRAPTNTALVDAVVANDHAALERLLADGAPLRCANAWGTPLTLFLDQADAETLRLLVAAGLDLNSKHFYEVVSDDHGPAPPLANLLYRDCLDVDGLRRLLDEGADPGLEEGLAFEMATRLADEEKAAALILLMLEYNDMRGVAWQDTALFSAFRHARLCTARLLRELGGHLKVCAMAACKTAEQLAFLLADENIDPLAAANYDEDPKTRLPLTRAVNREDLAMIRALAARGADPHRVHPHFKDELSPWGLAHMLNRGDLAAAMESAKGAAAPLFHK